MNKHKKRSRMTHRAKVPYSVCSTCQTASHPSSRWSPAAALSEDDGLNLVVLVSNNMSPLSLMYIQTDPFPIYVLGARRQYEATWQNDIPFVGLLDSTESCQWFLLQPEKKTDVFLRQMKQMIVRDYLDNTPSHSFLQRVRYIVKDTFLPVIILWSHNAVTKICCPRYFIFSFFSVRKSHYKLKVVSSDYL